MALVIGDSVSGDEIGRKRGWRWHLCRCDCGVRFWVGRSNVHRQKMCRACYERNPARCDLCGVTFTGQAGRNTHRRYCAAKRTA